MTKFYEPEDGVIYQCKHCGTNEISQSVQFFVPINAPEKGSRAEQVFEAYRSAENASSDFWCEGCQDHIDSDDIDEIGVEDR